jgi:hypothetical protein
LLAALPRARPPSTVQKRLLFPNTVCRLVGMIMAEQI